METPQNLQTFSVADLAQYTKEQRFTPSAAKNMHLFFVGKDNVHGVLKHLNSRCTKSLYFSMFGYDDPELNDIIWGKVMDPSIVTIITLDLSQAAGTHEKKLLDADKESSLAEFNTHVIVGQSVTHQINHTKGAVIDGVVGFEGSTNLSQTGEGFDPLAKEGNQVKAQNNTLMVFTDADSINNFEAQLINEHLHAAKPVKK